MPKPFDLSTFNPQVHTLPSNRAGRLALAAWERRDRRRREKHVQTLIERALRPFVGKVVTDDLREQVTNAVVRATNGVVPYKEVLALLETALGPMPQAGAL